MKSRTAFVRIVRTGLLAALASTALPASHAQTVDAATQKAVVDKAAETLRARYIFPDTGETAAAKIEAQLAAGAYKEFTQSRAFAEKVTADLYAVTKDKHMRLTVQGAPPPVPAGSARPGPPPPNQAGIVRADRLAGNMGYIEVVAFPPPASFKPTLDKAMTSLKDSKALIVDLRRNGGGSPQGVAYLVSFFADGKKPMLLNDFINRKAGTKEFTTTQTFTSATPVSFFGKPVYVLTSPRTFSGGEEFAYDMQAFKLGTLVGDTTGGGANPGGVLPVGSNFGIFMPGGRPVNPVTKTNWEGVGVIPEIKTPVEDALKVALEKLGQKPTAKDIDALSQAKLFQPRTTQDPRSEAAIRRSAAEFVSGQPSYDQMSPGLQTATRQQLPKLQRDFISLGAIKTMKFKEVGPGGADIYDVTFENGSLTWNITIDADGKIASSGIRSPPPVPQ